MPPPLKDQVDIYVAYVGLLASILLTILLALYVGSAIYILTGAVVSFACLLWMFVRHKVIDFTGIWTTKPARANILLLAFLTLFFLSIVVMVARNDTYTRPLAYFGLMSAMSGILALQFFIMPIQNRWIISSILQIVAVGFSLVISEAIIFPTVIGADPWWHQMNTENLIASGRVPTGTNYSSFPVFHLIIASYGIVGNLDYRLSSVLAISTVQTVINPIIVYLIGRRIANERIGLLAGLLLAVANSEIHMGFGPIPTCIGVVIIPFIIYFEHRRIGKGILGLRMVVLLMMMILIITHTLAAAMLALFIGVGWVVYRWRTGISENAHSKSFASGIVLTFLAGMFAWWAYTTTGLQILINQMVSESLPKIANRVPLDVVLFSRAVPISEQLFNNVGTFLFFGFSFVGFLYFVSRGRNLRFGLAWATMGLVSLTLPFISLLAGRDIVNDRWWYVAQVLLSTSLAVGLFSSICMVKGRTRKSVALLISTTIITFFMIMSTAANIDNRTFTNNTGVRLAFTESEVQAAIEIGVLYTDTIGTDLYYSGLVGGRGANAISIDNQIYNGSYEQSKANLILLRLEAVNHPIYLYTSLPWKIPQDSISVLESESFSRVYDCGSVIGYWKTI